MASGNSYNGWPANSDPAAIGVAQSLWFPGGVKTGDVTTVLRYVAEQFQARVEPIVGGWCWGYTYKQNVNNPSSLSCHASGTALDINAPDHPNGSGGTFSDAQVGEIYAILNEVQGAVEWLEGYDEMHFEIAVNAADLAVVAAQLPGGGAGPAPTPPGGGESTEDDDMVMQLLQVENGDGRIFAANVAGHRFFYVDNPDNLMSNQAAGLYSQDIKAVNEGMMMHIKWSCIDQQDYVVGQPL